MRGTVFGDEILIYRAMINKICKHKTNGTTYGTLDSIDTDQK